MVILMTHKQHFNLYIASCVKDGGIYYYRSDKGGVPEMAQFIPLDRPMYMISSCNKLYVILRAPFDNDESGLVTFDIDKDGYLSQTSEIISTKGEVACHLAVIDKNVYCTNYISGNIVKLPDTVVTHTGCGVNLPRQNKAHTHYVCASPDKKNILVTDLGLDKIFVYDKNLNKISDISLPQGHGPRHLAFHNNQKTFFCVNELYSTVSVLEYSDGEIKLLNTASALPDGYNGESTTAAIRCADNFVYVSNRGHDSISILKFSNNQLVLDKNFSAYGKTPRDFWVDDNKLIIANEESNNVSFISLSDGELMANIEIKAPVCVLLNDKGGK